MATRINWTTGPVSASEGFDNLRILVLNNTSFTRSATVRLYDITSTPKRRIFEQDLRLQPFETAFIDITNGALPAAWEAQGSAFSSSVRFYVTGRKGDANLPGNTILNSEFIRFGS